MAQVVGPRKRGRKPEALRLAAREFAAKLRAVKGEVEVAVEVVPGEGRRKGESVTLTVPKGAVVVPVALTRDKSDANVRAQLTAAFKDAVEVGSRDKGDKLALTSFGILTDDGEEFPVFVMSLKGDG